LGGWLHLAALWTLFGLARWLVQSLDVLQDDPVYLSTLQILAAGFGAWSGLWLSFHQRVVFGDQPWAEKLVWLGLAMGGIAWLSFSRADLDRHASELIAGVTRLLGAPMMPKSVPADELAYGMLLVAVPAVLWFARPLLGGLEWRHAAVRSLSDDFASREIAGAGWQWIWHPWVIRSGALLLFWWWLRTHFSPAATTGGTTGWMVLSTVAIMGMALAATLPTYFAAKSRRPWGAWLVFYGSWGLVIVASVAAWLLLQHYRIISRNAPWYVMVEAGQWFAIGAILTHMATFGLACCFKWRPVVRRLGGVPIVARGHSSGANGESATTSGERASLAAGSQRFSPRSIVMVSAAALLWLLGLTVALQQGVQRLNLCLWAFSDQDVWQRATLVARVQALQAADPATQSIDLLHERQRRALVVDSVGNLFCGVTISMVEDPQWSDLKRDIERFFPAVDWMYAFPVSRPEDTLSAAAWLLKIDGTQLRLRDLPATVRSRNWEIHGGEVTAADIVRCDPGVYVKFMGCRFAADVTFRDVPPAAYRIFEFQDCQFANLPLEYPARTRVRFSFSDGAAFESELPRYVQAIFQGAQITLVGPAADGVPPESAERHDSRWQRLIERRPIRGGVLVRPVGSHALVRAGGQLPANFVSADLETDDLGQVVGLVAKSVGSDSEESGFDVSVSPPLRWLAFDETFNFRDFHLFRALLAQSRLVKIEQPMNSALEFWLPVLLDLSPSESRLQRLFLAGNVALPTLEGLQALPWLETLLIHGRPLLPTELAVLAKFPALRTVVVITAGETPNVSEQQMLQQLAGLPHLDVHWVPMGRGLTSLADDF
jgi:hypothetical protein